ncbi:MFS transporter [Nocardioides sp. DS6]|uniref:MFS transporter n=1 Tax=Nocardioides eburneus TaxID=3231482 RepID=A0ABV3SXJ5_9ACTN
MSTTEPAAALRRRWSDIVRAAERHPIVTTAVVAAVLQLVWWVALANSGGDIAAQDAWADFARRNPGKAYNFAWYGGVHSVSYSVMSPYIMAGLGVRTTMMLAATVSAALIAFLLTRVRGLGHPLLPALVGAVALLGNSISGRTTFVLGMAFGLGALAAVVAWPDRWHGPGRPRWVRGSVVALLSLLATFGSPVDGLFLGLVAAALWLARRRAAAYALGIPPVLVVLLSKLFFPLDGVQPMHWSSAILPCLMAVLLALTAPAPWRLVRVACAVYVVAVLFSWLVHTPIGTNVTRLGLVFGGVVLTAVLVSGRARSPLPARVRLGGRLVRVPVTLLAALALVASGAWQVATAAKDLVHTSPAPAWDVDTAAVVAKLRSLGAGESRIEVVPSASHREVSALSQFVLARGWTRQVDVQYNARFYDQQDPLTAAEYRSWLHAWAVSYVVVPPGRPDNGSLTETALIKAGLPYLRLAWKDPNWRVYRVVDATPTVSGGATVSSWDEAGIVFSVPKPGRYVIKEKYSRHMVLVDALGEPFPSPETSADNVHGCLLEQQPPPADDTTDHAEDSARSGWTVLRAPAEGTYRLTSDYTHRTACPQE